MSYEDGSPRCLSRPVAGVLSGKQLYIGCVCTSKEGIRRSGELEN
jgi:hypothetical protein